MDSVRDHLKTCSFGEIPPEMVAMLRHETAKLDHQLSQSKETIPMGRGYIQFDPTPAGARTERNRRKRQNRKNRK